MENKIYTRLNLDEKMEIIRYSKTHNVSDKIIADTFSTKFRKRISRKTINDIKKQEENTLAIINSGNKNKYKKPFLKYENLDDKLQLWVEQLECKGGIITDEIIRNKARKIADECGHKDFKASMGWLSCFKSRHGLKLRKIHGESFGKSEVKVDEFFNELRNKIQKYGYENVYNADETGIFYKLIPSKSLCKNVRNGYKLLKDRISLLLCCNMTGTIKIKPLVIGKHANPRCFKMFDPQKLVDYKYSKKSWMTSIIFNKWLLDWDLQLEKSNKNILLVIDNCPSHKITIELKNIEIYYLPPNVSSLYQPLDQGIIKSFKTYFNNKKLENIMEKLEIGNETFKSYKELSIRDAILFIHYAWNELNASTIVNCFKHAKWYENETIKTISEENDEIFEEFIKRAKIEDPVEKNEFINLEYTENDVILQEMYQAEDILDDFEGDTNINFCNEKDSVIELEQVSEKDYYMALQTLKDYFNKKHVNLDAITGLNLISKALTKERSKFRMDNWLIKKNICE